MAKSVRISLANKCQLLFGAAVVLILTAALSVVWLRMQVLVRERQEETARRLGRAWIEDRLRSGAALSAVAGGASYRDGGQPVRLTLIEKDEFQAAAARDPFLRRAIERFETHETAEEFSAADETDRGEEVFRYALAIRKSRLKSAGGDLAAALESPALANPIEMVLDVRVESDLTGRQRMLNRIFIVAAGLFAGLLAIGVFWYITNRLILEPVRVLRDTAEKVSEGDLNIRSEVHTGDEFQQLGETFNHMLENLKANQDQLRTVNKSLDLKLGELAETNVALYEANKLKGEFLANVSHELRTPLNSILGFGEVLEESLKDRAGPQDEKRRRYAANIVASSRRLLELITDLLDLAKIEAGRLEVRVSPMSVSDTAEGLMNLIRPQAEKRQIELRLKIDPNLPVVHTDAGKFQQVLFNFLSNAVKFTPAGGVVTLSAALTQGTAIGGAPPPPAKLRASVSDTGPGIPLDQHERIFEKFTQLDPTVTREHAGTGLGLTISRELAHLLQGEIELDSDLGRGATFTLVIPLALGASRSVPLMPDLVGPPAERGAEAARPGG